MNREIKTKKVGKQKKLTNPCPVIKGETEVMVGSPRCITCQWFERKLEKNEMAIKIHDIQRMIISRPGFRLNQEMFKGYGKGNSDKG